MLRHFESVRRLDALAFEESGGVAEGELDFIEAQAEAALDTVPERFRDLLSNVPVVLEERPNLELVRTGFDPRALGLFEGLEHAQQASELHTAPTRIVLYYGNLLATFHEQDDLADEIEVTLLHEIGHYFGLDEDEVERLGLA
nr:metallopeptidase family protein [Pseudenhygromyxa sp. WMMC2535]